MSCPSPCRFSIGDRAVFQVLPPSRDDSALWLRAVQPGSSDLILHGSDPKRYVVHVYEPEDKPPRAVDLAVQKLNRYPIRLTGSGYRVGGHVESFADALALWRLAQDHPQEIELGATLAPELYRDIRKKIEAWLIEQRLSSSLSLEPRWNRWVVSGVLSDDFERQRVERAIQARFPFTLPQLEASQGAQPTLYFRVFLLELKRSEFHRFGLNLNFGPDTALRVRRTGIDSALKLYGAVEASGANGELRVLAQPELVVRTPGEAELFSGGEIPIRNQSRFGATTEWKRYGLLLSLKTKQFLHQKARLEIGVELSQLDVSGESKDRVPGLRATRMKTEVEARLGYPILLSGLTQEDTRKQVEGFPLLKDIPVLGSLFGSESFLDQNSELVVALVPHLRPPEPEMASFGEARPEGPVPPPRNRMSRDELQALKEHPHYPWIALE